MKILSGITAATLVGAALLLGSTDSQSQGRDCGNKTIQVNASGDVPVLSFRGGSAEEVHACVGDSVTWVLTGSNRAFFVDFFNGAPFDGATRRGSSGSSVTIVIGGPAQSGDVYDYAVEFAGGQPLDPRIVVD